MAMKISLQEFSRDFRSAFLNLHWKQWSALGVAAQVPPSAKWAIDLEALTLSTYAIGVHDRRLYQSALEWLQENRSWLNLPRLKRMGRIYTQPVPEPGLGPRIDPARFEWLVNTIRGFRNKGAAAGNPDGVDLAPRGVVTDPPLQKPALLQLKLRGLFGIDAKAEVLMYFLGNQGGNSNSIARELFFDQKNIYRVLENWRRSGILTGIKGARIGSFSLERKSAWLGTLEVKTAPLYFPWARSFHFLNRVFSALSQTPWSENEYALSSLFRDILNEAKKAGIFIKVGFPDPAQYAGEEYFHPFAEKIMELLTRLQ